jgi:hypothetical protein
MAKSGGTVVYRNYQQADMAGEPGTGGVIGKNDQKLY